MVIPEERAELRESLSALIAGRLSNDEFDEVYYRICVGSPDKAVREIGQFGWGLYSSDLLWPHYLTGLHSVSLETRGVAERCELFLQSRLEYEWPPDTSLGWVPWAQGLALAPGCSVSLFAALLVPVAVSNGSWGGASALVGVTVLASLPGVWTYRWLGRHARGRWDAFWNCGPREVWPFFSVTTFQLAHGSHGAGNDVGGASEGGLSSAAS